MFIADSVEECPKKSYNPFDKFELYIVPLVRFARAFFIFRGPIMIAANDNKKPAKLLCYRELSETRGIGYSRRHLYTLETEHKFPKRVPLGENRVGWIESEIDGWIAERAASRAA